jgi:thiosulfate/3-mercaptopyruvate sulfurtransferase
LICKIKTNTSIPYVKGAVNITRGDIVINQPVANMLCTKGSNCKVYGNNGISNDMTVIVYDTTGNMDAARLWWTLMVYGHENVRVVSGGFQALKNAGMELSSDKTPVTLAVFTIEDKNKDMIANRDDVMMLVECTQRR